MMSAVAASAMAVVPDARENNVLVAVESAPTEVTQADPGIEADATIVKARTLAEDTEDVYLPYYRLPGGSFYMGYIAGMSSKFANTAICTLPYVPVEYKLSTRLSTNMPGTATPDAVWKTAMLTQQASGPDYDVTYTTAQGSKVTTPAYPYGFQGIPAPVVSIGDRSYKANEKGMRTLWRGTIDFSESGWQRMGTLSYNLEKVASGLKASLARAASDSLSVTAYYDESIGDGLSKGYNVESIGNYYPQPASVYGITGLVLGCMIHDYKSPELRFDIYKVTPKEVTRSWTSGFKCDGVNLTLGERLGGGYLTKDEIPVSGEKNTWQNLYIPVREQIGEYIMDSFVNVDCPIVIMLSGFKVVKDASGNFSGDLVRPGLAWQYNAMVGCNAVYKGTYNGKSQFQTWNSRLWGSAPGSYYQICSYKMGPQVICSEIALEDVDYTYTAPAEGGTMTFDFQPSTNTSVFDWPKIDLGMDGIIDGDGAYDWYDVEVAEMDEKTGIQTVSVKVNALPAGVNGRSSDLKISVPGCYQVIKISQGNVSGIDNITAGSEVVGSIYYDMMGRQLTAEPQSGMYIRTDMMVDGSRVSTKLVK